MIRKATQSDAAAIETFLRPHAETSMFLRGNLAAHGVGRTTHGNSTDFFLWKDKEIRGVWGLTRNRYLLGEAPEVSSQGFADFAKAISGETVIGMTGSPETVARTLSACGLRDATMNRIMDEPLYALDLADLKDPGVGLRKAEARDISVLTRWFEAFAIETDSAPPEGAATDAARRAKAALGGPLRILDVADTPVAMASLSAVVGDLVQVGAVFTPPEFRRNGYGAAATAARLIEARRDGATRAILFAAGHQAGRVYERIGFQRVGDYRIALFSQAQRVQP